MCNFCGNVERVPFFNKFREFFSAPMKFVPLSDHIVEGVPRRETNRSTPITQELVSMNRTTSMDSMSSQTIEEKSPAFFGIPTNGDVEGAEVINSGAG